MKITDKLVIVIAGLSLGACSSMEREEDSTDMIYEELQSEVLSYDEQQQAAQPNLDGIDGLEAEIVELKNNAAIETAAVETMPIETAAVETMPNDKNATMMEANPVIIPAPILSENTSNSSLDNSEAIMVDSQPIEAAPLTVIQPTAPTFKYGVQVASYSNRDAVMRGWNALLKKDSTSFDGLEPLVYQKAVNGRTMYQLKVGPFLDKPFSNDFCKMLKDKGTDCFITQYNGDVFTAN